jgi:hypothetical protein
MNRSFCLLGFLLFAFFLSACDGLTTPGVFETARALDRAAGRAQVALTLGESAPLSEPGSSLSFDALLSDNRCPVGMSCPWRYSVAHTRFTLRTADGTAYVVPLTMPSGPPGLLPIEDAPWAMAGGYVIHLLRLQPYPGWPPDGVPVTATVVVEPCPDRCFEVWPPPDVP